MWSTSDSKRFETFEAHRIYVKPNKAGLLVVQQDLKVSTRGSKRFKTHLHLQLPFSAGVQVARQDSKHLKQVVLTDLKLSKHRIHVKLLYSGSIQVVESDSKLSKQIKFMRKYLTGLVY